MRLESAHRLFPWLGPLAIALLVGVIGAPATASTLDLQAGGEGVVRIETEAVTGIGQEQGVCRRDPSDVILLGDLHYVFYTKLRGGDPGYPGGYFGTVWYATSADEGHAWTERGCVVEKGAPGSFDSFGVFTPNVTLGYDGQVYVYYTGVGDGFDNRRDDYSSHNRTAIGAALVELDDSGELLRAEKLNGGAPLLLPSPAADGKFDSFRVDDAAIALRGKRYWLYYKGRRHEGTPGQTRMGLAIAERPEGPYLKQNDGAAVQPEGHEVLVWEQNEGVVSLVTNVGRGLYFAWDGLGFWKVTDQLSGRLRAPGAHRPELTEPGVQGPIRWGIHMATYGGDPFLERFEVEIPPLSISKTVTMDSLLREMTDRKRLARLPDPEYRSLQASSYNRESTHREAPGWFADSDGLGFVREETIRGETEWVVMEHEGPGCITRMWTPYFYYRLDDRTGPEVRIYLDGAEEPVIDENFVGLLTGKGLARPPFAACTARAGDLYLPIPFGRSCKVTMSAKPFYNIINYRAYVDGTTVETFSKERLQLLGPVLEETGEQLYEEPLTSELKADVREASLAPREALRVQLPGGPAAVTYLQLRIEPPDDADAGYLRSTVLSLSFDGEQTVWCPVGDLFGSADSLHPFVSWERAFSSNGDLTCRWTMPYRTGGELVLENLGDQPLEAEVHFKATHWSWDERSMHFHTSWRPDELVAGTPFFDWNFIDIHGQGVFVGDAWTVLNPTLGWWGEGDEKIYVDDAWAAGFPTHFGTGTEDYYGWAGGVVPTREDEFDEPFLANVRVGGAGERARGYNICTRTRVLDAIPFERRLRFDMEASAGTDQRRPSDLLGYSAVSFWYARPGATSNRPPLPESAARPIVTLEELEAKAVEIRARGSFATITPVTRGDFHAPGAGWGESSWLDQHQAINRIAEAGALDLVFLGDSITQSWGGPGRSVWSPAAEVWTEFYGRRRAANFGISGDRTQHVLWRIENGNLDGLEPRAIVLMIGTNNLAHDPAADIALGIGAVVEFLESKTPSAAVLLCGIVRGESPADPLRRKAEQVNELIRPLAARPNVHYVDLPERFYLPDFQADPELMRGDFVHFSAAGYRAWAEELEPHFAGGPPDDELELLVEPLPAGSRATLEDHRPRPHLLADPEWFTWGASVVKADDGRYHMFYSRWPRELGFLAWLTHSEVAHAVADRPEGPYRYLDTALTARGQAQWNRVTAHNPKIKVFEGKYYLYHCSTNGDFSESELVETARAGYQHPRWKVLRENQRTGVAVAETLAGPWRRSEQPIVEPAGPITTLTVNPAVTRGPDGTYFMIVKGDKPNETRFIRNQALATAPSPVGPFTIQAKPVIDSFDTEDASIWYDEERERFYAVFHAHDHISLITSPDGHDWSRARHYRASEKQVSFDDGTTWKPDRLERPFVLTDDTGQPIMLFLAARKGDLACNLHLPLRPGKR